VLHLGIPRKQSTAGSRSTAGSFLETRIIPATSTTDSESHILVVRAMVMARELLELVYELLQAEIRHQINIYMEQAQTGAVVIPRLQQPGDDGGERHSARQQPRTFWAFPCWDTDLSCLDVHLSRSLQNILSHTS